MTDDGPFLNRLLRSDNFQHLNYLLLRLEYPLGSEAFYHSTLLSVIIKLKFVEVSRRHTLHSNTSMEVNANEVQSDHYVVEWNLNL